MREQLSTCDPTLVARGGNDYGTGRLSAVQGQTKVRIVLAITADHGEAQIDQARTGVNGHRNRGGKLGNIGSKGFVFREQRDVNQLAIRAKAGRVEITPRPQEPNNKCAVLAGRAGGGPACSITQ
jgi:hypothetical protein